MFSRGGWFITPIAPEFVKFDNQIENSSFIAFYDLCRKYPNTANVITGEIHVKNLAYVAHAAIFIADHLLFHFLGIFFEPVVYKKKILEYENKIIQALNELKID